MGKEQQHPEVYECHPSFQGLAVSVERENQRQVLYLPEDEKPENREQDPEQPPLVMKLDRERLRELCHPGRPACRTRYGPEGQDKPSNQDFALSGVIRDDRNQAWTFAAVADGVSGKTFWPERSSRIACLAAFEFFRTRIREGKLLRSDETGDLKAENQEIRSGLVKCLQDELMRDHLHLQRAKNVFPRGFAESIYQNKRQELSFWYNTTLLVAVAGPELGLLFWAGDGGIFFRKEKKGQEPESQHLLRSGEALEIRSFISTNVHESDFDAAVMDLKGCDRVSILLASDGLDRTMQKEAKDYSLLADACLAGSDPGASFESVLDDVMGRPDVENDNWSLAFLDWKADQCFEEEPAEPNFRPLVPAKNDFESGRPKPETAPPPFLPTDGGEADGSQLASGRQEVGRTKSVLPHKRSGASAVSAWGTFGILASLAAFLFFLLFQRVQPEGSGGDEEDQPRKPRAVPAFAEGGAAIAATEVG